MISDNPEKLISDFLFLIKKEREELHSLVNDSGLSVADVVAKALGLPLYVDETRVANVGGVKIMLNPGQKSILAVVNEIDSKLVLLERRGEKIQKVWEEVKGRMNDERLRAVLIANQKLELVLVV
jgi:tRNA pseudouridine-54 N-methylase